MLRTIPITVMAAVATGALLVTGCGDGDDGAGGDGRLDVVASFYPLAFVAERTGGDAVDVHDLTPPGAEPHDLELSSDDVDRIADADLVVVLGGGFQPGVERAATRRDGPTIVVTDLVPGAEDDPHVWLDPTRLGEVATAVIEALAGIDPARAERFRAHGGELQEQLGLLDEEMAAGLGACQRQELVTAHEAFGWLARRYGLVQHAIAGISPDQEPDPRRLDELADVVEGGGVTTVFTEELVSPKVAETLARETGARTEVLSTLEAAPGSGDYFTAMQENVRKLRVALACP